MGTTQQFKNLIKKAKQLQIKTISELEDLIGTEDFSVERNPITGADYEIAKKQLKLKKL